MMVILLVYHTGMDNLAQQIYYYTILECLVCNMQINEQIQDKV